MFVFPVELQYHLLQFDEEEYEEEYDDNAPVSNRKKAMLIIMGLILIILIILGASILVTNHQKNNDFNFQLKMISGLIETVLYYLQDTGQLYYILLCIWLVSRLVLKI